MSLLLYGNAGPEPSYPLWFWIQDTRWQWRVVRWLLRLQWAVRCWLLRLQWRMRDWR